MNRTRLRMFIRLLAILVIYLFVLQQYLYHNKKRSSTTLATPTTKLAIIHKYLRRHRLSRQYWELFNRTNLYLEDDIKDQISNHNKDQFVWNANRFGPLKNDSIVIIIQVHTNVTYLRTLIKGLSNAKNISEALLIFSHDYYNNVINAIVQRIDFCKVMRIFYPYSIQLYPHEFPGTDPNDCFKNMTKIQALVRDCNNALYPDNLGHYRDADYAQQKHHWWWQANRVFSELKITKYFTGLVLFLEEENYVVEDFLHVLQLLTQSNRNLCPHCNIMSLGKNAPEAIYSPYYNTFSVEQFTPQRNKALAFNRSTWLSIRQCAQTFCQYDDYHWDWTLHYVSGNCLKRKLTCMAIKEPRVFHIGNHVTKINGRTFRSSLYRVNEILYLARKSKQLFPPNLTMTNYVSRKKWTPPVKPAGKWADPRDHQLCLTMYQEQDSNNKVAKD